jgi:hypothetical protein
LSLQVLWATFLSLPIDFPQQESVFVRLHAEPGDRWFFGAITDENSRQAMIPLCFFAKAKRHVVIICRDKDVANTKNNPFTIKGQRSIRHQPAGCIWQKMEALPFASCPGVNKGKIACAVFLS